MTIPAIKEARRRSRSRVPTSAPGFCKREVRECLSLNLGHVIVSRSGSAAEAWENARKKHLTSDPADIPRGAAPFWLGGSDGNGHVSLGVGNGGHWTTDLLRDGFFDRTGIRLVSRKWNSLRLVGWAEDFDGVDVWRNGKPIVAAGRRAFFSSPASFDFALVERNLGVEHEVNDREAAHGIAYNYVTGEWS